MATLGEITLANLGSGAASEKWDEEFRKVIENILDPNTEATAKRVISLRVAITPEPNRRRGQIKITAESRLAGTLAYQTQAFFGKDKTTGDVVACEDNPNQVTIDDFIETNKNVEELPLAERKAVR